MIWTVTSFITLPANVDRMVSIVFLARLVRLSTSVIKIPSLLNESLTQKDVADLLRHTEKVNEMHYNYSTADFQEKLTALNHLSRQMEEKVTIKIS